MDGHHRLKRFGADIGKEEGVAMSPQAVLAIHGGAGEIDRGAFSSGAERAFRDALDAVLEQGGRALERGVSALDVVTQAVVMLEDCPLFNAGRGAAYTSAETHELDAAIMDGTTRAAGAVACVRGVRNPVLGARMVMERSPHVLMVGEGATAFLREQGAVFEPESYFHSERRLVQLREARETGFFGMSTERESAPADQGSPERIVPLAAPLDERSKMGTVGAVALDRYGHLAAAASTGGLTNKLPGRVGDTAVIGAGCYADERVAVACTGMGECFIRLGVAGGVAARMRYRGASLEEAGEEAIDEIRQLGGKGGLIAVDRSGGVVIPFHAGGMYRGWTRAGGVRHVAIYGDEQLGDEPLGPAL